MSSLVSVLSTVYSTLSTHHSIPPTPHYLFPSCVLLLFIHFISSFFPIHLFLFYSMYFPAIHSIPHHFHLPLLFASSFFVMHSTFIPSTSSSPFFNFLPVPSLRLFIIHFTTLLPHFSHTTLSFSFTSLSWHTILFPSYSPPPLYLIPRYLFSYASLLSSDTTPPFASHHLPRYHQHANPSCIPPSNPFLPTTPSHPPPPPPLPMYPEPFYPC